MKRAIIILLFLSLVKSAFADIEQFLYVEHSEQVTMQRTAQAKLLNS